MSARELSAAEAIDLIKEVDSIGLGLVSGTPRTLLEELSKRSDWQDLSFSGGLLLGDYGVFTHPNVHYRATFYGGAERTYRDQGADIEITPCSFATTD